MDNVVAFPRSPLIPEGLPSTPEQAKATVELVRHLFINEMTEALVGTLVQQMMAGGFNILDVVHEKDFAFLIETVRSSLCKTIGLYHPIQDVSDHIMEETDEEGVLRIAESISVKFQDDEGDNDPVSETS